MILNVDIDGVLRNFMQATIDVYKKHYDPKCSIEYNDIVEYFFNRELPLIGKDFRAFYRKHPEEIYVNAEPYEGVKETLTELQKNHLINIVTKQPVGLEKYSLYWLEKNEIPYDNFMVTQDKDLIFGDIFVDDYIGNLENFTRGVSVCVNQPWNKKWEGERIHNFNELPSWIKNYEEK